MFTSLSHVDYLLAFYIFFCLCAAHLDYLLESIGLFPMFLISFFECFGEASGPSFSLLIYLFLIKKRE